MVLLQWTALLGLCWIAHLALRQRHARWRVILWRSALCFALVLPAAQFLPLPVIEVPVEPRTAPIEMRSELSESSKATASAQAAPPSFITPAESRGAGASAPPATTVVNSSETTGTLPWGTVFLGLWAAGFAVAAVRLIRLHLQLSRIRKDSVPADPDLEERAKDFAARMGVRQPINVRVSGTIQSPFVCGVFQPMILIPLRLLEKLSPQQASALLAHEIAHVLRRDTFWCVAWRWMLAVCWFHPLVWRIPSAHNLACEQEADRIAAAGFDDRRTYTQTLAQLTLRLAAPPAVETRLTVNGTSQIVRRLNHLGRQGLGAWKRRHTVAAFGLTGSLLLGAAGFQFTSAAEPESAEQPRPAEPELGQVTITVQDQDGNPIEGAMIELRYVRLQALLDGVRHIGLTGRAHSNAPTVATNSTGIAVIEYPREAPYRDEDGFTGETVGVNVSVSHPDFGTSRHSVPVDGSADPLRLERATRVEVSAYFGEERHPVTVFTPSLSIRNRIVPSLTRGANGTIEYPSLTPGQHLLQLSGRLPSGEFVHSDTFAFTAEPGEHHRFELEMKPGIRLEGRIDDNVPRPVTNGRVIISVRSNQFPDSGLSPDNLRNLDELTEEFGSPRFWTSHREIAEDGSFLFDSVPPGRVDVIVYGDGFASESPLTRISGIAVPQAFPLSSPITSIEVTTESTSTLQVTAMSHDGLAVEGATVQVHPVVHRIGWTGNTTFGHITTPIEGTYRTLPISSSAEGTYRTLPSLPVLSYSAVTDENGIAVLTNIPAFTRRLSINHPDFEAPFETENYSRDIRFELSPGETTEIEVTLQPKGTDSLADFN